MDYRNFIYNPEERDTYEELVQITVLLNKIRDNERAFEFAYAYLSGFADGVKSCEPITQ